MPPKGLNKRSEGGIFHLQEVLNAGHGQEVWIDRGTAPQDANVLVTLSNHSGEHTVLVTPDQISDSSAKLFVQTPPERVVTGADRAKARAKKVLTVVGYAFAGVMIVFSSLSATGIVKARIVLTNSMTPAINPGDIVLTAAPEKYAPELGRVIAYQGRRFDGSPVGVFSHRIIGGDAAKGWLVKGDNNPDPDTQKPKGADILGVVFFVIPFVGKFLTKQALIIIAPIAVAIWMAIDTFRESDEE